jgi:protein SCO1/2
VIAALISVALAIGLDEHVGDKVPTGITLTDSSGRTTELGALFDGHRPVVLVMAYARCRLLCSVVLHGIGDAIRASKHTPGVDFLPVVVSLDPTETPDEAARRQATLLERIGRGRDRQIWPYLVGDPISIAALASSLGFRYAWDAKTEQYAHPAVVFVLTGDGRIAEYVRGVTFDGLDAAIERASRGTLTQDTAEDLLRCFHFDPTSRRYGSKIHLAFEIGASTVLAGVIIFVVSLLAWERRRRRQSERGREAATNQRERRRR